MNFLIILESLKFYKVRHERTVQIWFLLLYGLNMLPYILPIGDRDFSLYLSAVEDLLAGKLPAQGLNVLQLLTPGNWLLLGLSVLAGLINGFFTLMYATLYVGENDDMKPRQSFTRSLAAIPRLILLALLLAVPAVLSACLAFLPLVVFVVMMYFLPLNLTINRQPLAESMHQSYLGTQRQKIFIFVQVVLVSLLITLPQNIIEAVTPDGYLPYLFITTFFTILRAFVQGRLMGILYLFLVKKVPVVIPSKPNGQKQL